MREPDGYIATSEVMGTVASVQIRDLCANASRRRQRLDACNELFASLHHDEATFSTFLPTSAISRVNRGELDIADAPKEVAEVLDACTWLEHASHGAFTMHRPQTQQRQQRLIDPSGFVKGWAAQRATQHLVDAGLRHWYCSVGGDIAISGSPTRDNAPWRIAITDPFDTGAVKAIIPLSAGAIATSGGYERGDHIWTDADADRRWASFTVIGPELQWADAFATTCYAMGASGLDWLAQFDGYDGVAIDRSGQVVVSRAFL